MSLVARRILVTGCGRSGTAYTSSLLSALDLRCGHEAVFSLHCVERGEVDWPADMPAESSWLAAPFLASLPADTAILHQVRHPLAVIRSLVRIRLFDGGDPYAAFAGRFMGELDGTSPLEACLRYWDEWNALVETQAQEVGLAYHRYGLQDLQPAFLSGLLSEVGYMRSPEEIEDRIRHVRSDRNTSGDKSRDEQLTWASLPECDAKRAVEERALAYGFEDLDRP